MDRHEVPLNGMGPDSRELLTQPGRVPGLSKVKRRRGSAASGLNTGILEVVSTAAVMRGLEFFSLPTKVSGNGFPVPAQIWAEESTRHGQIHLLDVATDYVLGSEFSGTTYKTNGQAAGFDSPAMPYDGNGNTGFMRFAYEENRRRAVAGTRRHIGMKDSEYGGGYFACPWRWRNRSYSLSPSAITGLIDFQPGGLVMPLWPGDALVASYPAKQAAAAPWLMGDTMFRAVAFEWEDGTVSMPFIPRDKNATLANGIGLFIVNDDASSNFYKTVPWTNLPIGPAGVVKRRLYRTAKVSKTAVAAGAWPALADGNGNTLLKLCHIVEDNITKAWDDPNGNDGSLVDDQYLRLDQIWPPRGRYEAVFDERHFTGNLRPNPCAIVLAPTGIAADYDVNAPSTNDFSTTGVQFFYQIFRSGGTFELRLKKLVGGVTTQVAYALSAALTVEGLVDKINTSVHADASGQWRAQVVPGASRIIGTDHLAPTCIVSANCALAGTALFMGVSGAQVAEGMKVSGGGLPAGTYVVKNTGGGNAIISSSGAFGATTLTFFSDTGDEGVTTDASIGVIAAWANSRYGILAFIQGYLDFLGTSPRDFCLTSGGPTDKPNAANLFHTLPGGRYSAEVDAGVLMGAAPLHHGGVVFYSKRIGYYKNEHAGTSGLDEDYRMNWIEFETGCTSPYSITFGNGWVGCWTTKGYWVFDGESAAIISGRHFDQNTQKGELAFEAALCRAAAEAAVETNDYYMHAAYVDGRIWLNYRTEAGTFGTLCYDASTNIQALGLRQVLQEATPDSDELTRYTSAYQTPLNVPQGPDLGQPFGWSARCTYNWRALPEGTGGAIGSVIGADGIRHLYQCDDKNDRPNCGIVQEFETVGNFLDGTSPNVWEFFSTTDMAGKMKKFKPVGPITILYRLIVAAGVSPVIGSIYRNQARTGGGILNLPATGNDFFTRKVFNCPIPAKIASDVIEINLHNGFLGDGQDQDFEMSVITVPVLMLDSVN